MSENPKQELEIVSRLPESNLVEGEDVVALICLAGKLLTAINTKDNKGIIKVWTGVLQLLYEFQAHDCPIYHMTNGLNHEFFTSASDSTISQWVEVDAADEGEEGPCCKRKQIMREMYEPAWRLRFDPSTQRLYSGDSTGEVRVWENGELVGCLGTVEEIWDMQIDNGILFTTRNLDVYLTTLRMKDEERINWSIKNTIEGTGPLLIINERLCLISRRNNNLLVHCLKTKGNPCLACLTGHEAIITALVGDSVNGVVYSGGFDRKVVAWDLASFEKVACSVDLKGYINSMAFDAQTGIVYAGGENRFICGMKLAKKG